MDEITQAIAAVTDQTAPTETTPEVKAPSPKEDALFASRFAALSKREKALTTKQAELKALEAEVAEYRKTKEGAKLNPAAVLEKLGLTYKEITDFYLNGGKATPEAVTSEAEKRMEQRIKELEERQSKEAAAAEERAVTQFKTQLNDYLTSNADKYELIAANDASEVVFATIEEVWKQSGKLLSAQEAADKVEAFYEQEQLEKFSKLKKFQAKFSPQSSEQSALQAITTAQTPTLSARTHSASVQPTPRRYVSDDEAIAAAAKLMIR